MLSLIFISLTQTKYCPAKAKTILTRTSKDFNARILELTASARLFANIYQNRNILFMLF